MKKLYFLFLTLLIFSLSFGQATDLYFSMYGEGSSNNKFLEIYNGTGADVDLSLYSLSTCSNGCDVASEFDYPDTLTFAPGTMLADGDVYVIAHGSANASILAEADVTFTFLSNGDDAMALTLAGATAAAYTIVDMLGDLSAVDGDGWDVAGITNATYNHTFTRKSSICSPNPNELGSFGTDAATSEWIVTASDSEWANIGTFTGCITSPTVNITSPSNTSSLASGTTSVDVVFNAENAPGGSTFDITVTTNGGTPAIFTNVTSPYTITPTADGDSFEVTVDLVDGGIVASDTVTFDIAYPCDLQIGTITETCDAITSGTTDTYNVTLDFTGGGTSTYTVDTGGVGTVDFTLGDPDVDATGTITITGITENTDFVVTFTGNPANSSCDFTRNINSPDCDPALTLPQYDSFDYPDGSLIDNPNWDNFSGTDGDLLVTSGQAVLNHGTGSEDASIAFSSVTGNIYYAFDFIVNNPGGPITGGDYEYFAIFKDDGFTYRARMDIVNASGGGDFTVGISTTGSTADVTWATDLSFDTTYRATVRYDQDLNIAELWIDASSESDTSIIGTDQADPGTSITQFGLRQSGSSLDEVILIDNLAITTAFSATLSTENIISLDAFKIFPNPTSTGYVNIISNSSDAIQAQVFDILGKEVINNTVENNRLNVSGLNAGIYIVKLTQNEASITKKLVIK